VRYCITTWGNAT